MASKRKEERNAKTFQVLLAKLWRSLRSAYFYHARPRLVKSVLQF